MAPPPVLPSGGEEAYSHPADAQRQRQGKQNAIEKTPPAGLSDPRGIRTDSSQRRQGGHISIEVRQAGMYRHPRTELGAQTGRARHYQGPRRPCRLGGLLKQTIAADGDKFALQRLLREVDMGMRELKAAAMRIK